MLLTAVIIRSIVITVKYQDKRPKGSFLKADERFWGPGQEDYWT